MWILYLGRIGNMSWNLTRRCLLKIKPTYLLLMVYLLVLFMSYRLIVTSLQKSNAVKHVHSKVSEKNPEFVMFRRRESYVSDFNTNPNLLNSAEDIPMLEYFFKVPNGSEKDVSTSNSYFSDYAKTIKPDCSGHVVGYSGRMLRFRNVIMDRNYSHAKALGGAEIKGIMNQKEEAEVYRLEKGFLKVPCEKADIEYKFGKHSAHLMDWVYSIEYNDRFKLAQFLSKSNGTVTQDQSFTIAVMRYEFTNVYWVVMDLYNIYLTMSFFKKTLPETKVLLIDERPQNSMDSLYQTVYGAKQLHEYPQLTVLNDMVWMFPRYYGPILKKQATIPLAREFRRDVLQAYGLSDNHMVNCNALNIRFVFRRNYVAHPRNPSGLVWRKIKNEDELLNATRNAYPTASVQGVQLDKLQIKEQLDYISNADIFVGMHGAAFGFSLFLPSGSGAIEMFPQYVGANWHMEYLAKWAGVHYKMWKNKNKNLEDTKERYTTVPSDILLILLKSTVRNIC